MCALVGQIKNLKMQAACYAEMLLYTHKTLLCQIIKHNLNLQES